jgi:uncharacterized protein (TIGR02996 family)
VTDREALLAAILREPDEDMPRLAFADWLDENGEPERAEFIRVQCRLARMPAPLKAKKLRSVVHVTRELLEDARFDLLGFAHDEAVRRLASADTSPTLRERHRANLEARERELIDRLALDWFDAARFHPDWYAIGNVRDGYGNNHHHGGWSRGGEYIEADFRRGFLHSVTCTAADWTEHGPAILREHPVREVEFTTPAQDDLMFVEGRVGGQVCWHCPDYRGVRFKLVTLFGRPVFIGQTIGGFTGTLTVDELRAVE